MTALKFTHNHRVTYAECTVGNHIYYSRYLDILESARGEFFRHLGQSFLQLQQNHLAFPVIEAHLRYRAPARYDDLLSVQVWLTQATGIRLAFAYDMYNQHQTLLLHATTAHICASTDEKPQRLPEPLIAQLQPYLAPPTGS